MKKYLLCLALILGLVPFSSTLLLADRNKNIINYELQLLNSVIPNTKISKYEPSEIEGFYKVYLENGNLFYVNPFNKLILFGEIWTNTGFSITQNARTKWQQELSKTTLANPNKDYKVEDLTKAAKQVKYGKGSSKYEYILFTDPECPFCKIVEEYFEDNKNLDLHVIFVPLSSIHKNAKEWALKALSSKDLKQSLKDLKQQKIPNVSITKEAETELEAMNKLATKLEVTGTPKIIVIDKNENKIIDSIVGANIKEIEKYQKENN